MIHPTLYLSLVSDHGAFVGRLCQDPPPCPPALTWLPSIDQIALPDFNAGAMENWGLVTYRENSLLFDPQDSSISNKERVVTVIAHELAHQVDRWL